MDVNKNKYKKKKMESCLAQLKMTDGDEYRDLTPRQLLKHNTTLRASVAL